MNIGIISCEVLVCNHFLYCRVAGTCRFPHIREIPHTGLLYQVCGILWISLRPLAKFTSRKLGYLLYEVKAIEMNERVVLVAVRYLAIAVALLHTSLGANPTLRVVYRLDDIDNKNELECIVGYFVRSGARFTFKEPGTEVVEADSVMERRFTIYPSNESLVTCTIDSEESDPVRVAGMCNRLSP